MKITNADMSNDELKKYAKAVFCIVIPYFIIVIALIFFCIKKFKELQTLLYQKPGEMLYTGNGPAVGIFITLFFVPVALYFLISKFFFPRYWKRELSEDKYFSGKNIERIFMVVVIVTILGLAVLISNFKTYIVLGNDYVAISKSIFGPDREYCRYSDISIEEPEDRVHNTYSYFACGKRLPTFIDNENLIKNIQNRQKSVGTKIAYPLPVSPATNIRNGMGHFISIFIMIFGTFFTLKWLGKKRKNEHFK